jgi:hypothetical protein
MLNADNKLKPYKNESLDGHVIENKKTSSFKILRNWSCIELGDFDHWVFRFIENVQRFFLAINLVFLKMDRL